MIIIYAKSQQKMEIKMKKQIMISLMGILGLCATLPAVAADEMSFFVTSVGSGKGGDLGGLEGADAHCAVLAKAAGSTKTDWKAYLSTEADGKRGVSARDRIGKGPWYNAKGELIAKNLTELHVYNTSITKENALTEKGETINGRGDKPNEHDILTGSLEDGTAFFPDDKDHTCNNWTSSDTGSAQVGHHDREGGGKLAWNSVHGTRGCSADALKKTGGNGLFYCFAK